jgi:hypothetical protein
MYNAHDKLPPSSYQKWQTILNKAWPQPNDNLFPNSYQNYLQTQIFGLKIFPQELYARQTIATVPSQVHLTTILLAEDYLQGGKI